MQVYILYDSKVWAELMDSTMVGRYITLRFSMYSHFHTDAHSLQVFGSKWYDKGIACSAAITL